jgi:hypothetical protein
MEVVLCGATTTRLFASSSSSPTSVMAAGATERESSSPSVVPSSCTYMQEWCHSSTGGTIMESVCARNARMISHGGEPTEIWIHQRLRQQQDDDDHSLLLLDDDDDFPPALVRMLSRDNYDTTMHVLTQGIIEALQSSLPWSKRGEAFFLQYSMVRDGASLDTLLDKVRGVQYSVLAIETMNGEVFGGFVGQAWERSSSDYHFYGTGESFLWRVPMQRSSSFDSSLCGTERDVQLDIYPFSHDNDNVQSVIGDRLIIGGGSSSSSSDNDDGDNSKRWGFGLCLEGDLLRGSSASCLTFDSPPLSMIHHSDGSTFDVRNIEVWSLTSCGTVEEAEKIHRKRNLLQRAGLTIPKKLMSSFRKRLHNNNKKDNNKNNSRK